MASFRMAVLRHRAPRLRPRTAGPRPQALLAVSLVVALAACGTDRNAPAGLPRQPQLTTIAVPNLEHRGAGLAASGNEVVATWTADNGHETNVFAAVSHDAGLTFGAPVRVNDIDGDARVSGEQAPRVAMGKDIVVAWQSRRGGKSAVRLARSSDGGRSFAPAISIHADGLEGTRGWASLDVDDGGFAHLVWLDTRPERRPAPRPAAPAATGHVHGGTAMATPQNIFHARIGQSGPPVESRIAPNVCFCCKTAVATSADGTIYAAWRHIYPPNYRDMAVARSTDGGTTFSPPVRLSEDGWAVDGCPEDGPSMAVDDQGVLHVAWPTIAPGRTDRKAIFYTYSSDGGRTFAPRLQIDEPSSARKPAHPQLSLAGRTVVVTWDEDEGAARHVKVRKIHVDRTDPRTPPRPGTIATIDIAATAGYPAIASTTSGTLVAWTATSPNSAVHVARLEE